MPPLFADAGLICARSKEHANCLDELRNQVGPGCGSCRARPGAAQVVGEFLPGGIGFLSPAGC